MSSSRETDRRAAYRVSLSADDAISAEVTSKSGQAHGDVLDLSLNGAAVLFPIAQDPSFALGELVTVHLQSSKMGLVEVKATVQKRTELDDTRRFGLAFSEPDVLRAKLSAKLLRLFNQRKAFRIEPNEAAPVDVLVCAEELEVVGLLRDISADGAGVLIAPESEARLSRVIHVTLKLRLPPEDKPLAFKASIRIRVAEAEHIFYGLSCAPGFPWTLDCERVLAGGVSKWGSQIKVRRRRREPGGRPEMLPGTAVGDGFRPGASARRCGVCCAARILSPCRGSWGSRRRGPRRGGISFWPQARPA